MNLKLLLCLALAMSFGSHFAAAQNPAKPAEFLDLPPIANANPSIRVPQQIRVPTKLQIERTTNMLSVTVDDQSSLETTNLTVGTNMITGVESHWFVYPVGEPHPTNGVVGLSGGLGFDLGTSYWHTKPDGILLRGQKYVVELDLIFFETDIPAQHMWCPYGKNYKVIWQQTLKQVVE